MRTVTEQRTYCTTCGAQLFSADDMALCKRQHMLERLVSTEEGRRTYAMLTHMGFNDQPDKHYRDTRQHTGTSIPQFAAQHAEEK